MQPIEQVRPSNRIDVPATLPESALSLNLASQQPVATGSASRRRSRVPSTAPRCGSLPDCFRSLQERLAIENGKRSGTGSADNEPARQTSTLNDLT